MDTINLKKSAPNYPSALQQRLNEDVPDTIAAIGNLDILSHNSTAFFCSTKYPGDLIVKIYDLAQILRDAGPASKTESFCKDIISWQKSIYTFESDYNKNLIGMGARPVNMDNISG